MCFDGNFDWFVVLGIIYNVEWMLLWVLFDQYVLMGLCSCELLGDSGNVVGGCLNYVLFDDMLQQFQLKLCSDIDVSELMFGYNVCIDVIQGCIDQCVCGFELWIDVYGVVWVVKGLFVISEVCYDVCVYVIDIGEIVVCFDKVYDLYELLLGFVYDVKVQEFGDQDVVYQVFCMQNDGLRGSGGNLQ